MARKLAQSLASSSVRRAGGQIELRGKVKRALLGKRNPVVVKRVVCGRYQTVGRAKPDNITTRVASCKTARRMARRFYRGAWTNILGARHPSDAARTSAGTARSGTSRPTCAAPHRVVAWCAGSTERESVRRCPEIRFFPQFAKSGGRGEMHCVLGRVDSRAWEGPRGRSSSPTASDAVPLSHKAQRQGPACRSGGNDVEHNSQQGHRRSCGGLRQGECLWWIAHDQLGGDAGPVQVARLVNRLWELNRERIGTGEPGLLRAGTGLQLP